MKVRSSGLNFDAEAASPFLRWLHNPWPSLFFNMISPLFLLFYWHFWAQTKVISFSKVSIALYKDLKPRHDICKKMDPRPWILPSTAIFWLQKRNFAGPFNINFDDIFLLNMGWIGSLLLIFLGELPQSVCKQTPISIVWATQCIQPTQHLHERIFHNFDQSFTTHCSVYGCIISRNIDFFRKDE